MRAQPGTLTDEIKGTRTRNAFFEKQSIEDVGYAKKIRIKRDPETIYSFKKDRALGKYAWFDN